MSTEADTCRKYVLPRLIAAGWDDEPHSFTEQRTITDGRIVVTATRPRRRPQKRADYLLRYTRDFTIAVVEAKASYKSAGDGLQQAKEYAELLDLKFAYATNGRDIVEFDYLTGQERFVDGFPSPGELWERLKTGQRIGDQVAERLLTPSGPSGKSARYYQEIAINRTVQAILSGRPRLLLTLATGTGKTFIAFQICWKLWKANWNRQGQPRPPRMLYLSDRNILIDDPKDKDFAPFGEARHKIERGEAIKSRQMYFSTYQAIARDESRPGLYREYAPDFFDLVIVDECHRGSASDESNWREILEYFRPACQLGMTATPLRDDNKDTYAYFGNPIYTYSLRQGIEDGFLAPYRVHRVVTTYDAVGWRPSRDDLDRFGRPIPDDEYHTPDFERVVAMRKRTEAIARHLSDFLSSTNRMAKTMVFCVDQDHADEMRRALTNANSDLVAQYPDYVCRVTAVEGDVGFGHLANFQDVDKDSPVILTTSRLLTTGVDVPTCRNIAIARVVNSMTEFKQIIGRGTRVRDDYGKLYFNIVDYTGSATRLFADPDFDGEPEITADIEIDENGNVVNRGPEYRSPEAGAAEVDGPGAGPTVLEPPKTRERRKYYFDGGQVEIVAEVVYDLDPSGKRLGVVQYVDYTAQSVRTLYPSSTQLRHDWADPARRAEVIELLAERGIDFAHLAEVTRQPDADPFDLLCHVVYNAPLRTRRERADRLRRDRKDFFDQYAPSARAILEELLEKYAEHGLAQLKIPEVLRIPPISEHGNVVEIAGLFGGPDKLREAVGQLQALLYAA